MFGTSKWMMRLLTALVVAAGSIVAVAGAAQAYNAGDCNQALGSLNVIAIEPFSVDGGGADFGDDVHFGGAPQGNAVICWSIDGRVSVIGKLYADNFREPLVATAKIRFQRTTGRFSGTTTRSVVTQGGWPASLEVKKVSPRGNFDRVHIQLFTFQDSGLAGPSHDILVARRDFHR